MRRRSQGLGSGWFAGLMMRSRSRHLSRRWNADVFAFVAVGMDEVLLARVRMRGVLLRRSGRVLVVGLALLEWW